MSTTDPQTLRANWPSRRPRLVQLAEAADAVEYLRPRIKVHADTGCWRWLGAKNSQGYGYMWVDGRTVRAHRWAYEHIGGHAIPDGHEVDHMGCHTVLCVNPAHLQALDPDEHKALTKERRDQLKAAGEGWAWFPPTWPRNLDEWAAIIRLDDGRIAPPGAQIIDPLDR